MLLVFAACGGDESSPEASPTATATAQAPTPTATPTQAPGSGSRGAEQFDPQRALAHVQALAVDIGSRPAGSEAEDAAASYIRDQLASYGYEAAVQHFTFDLFADAGSTLRVLSPQEQLIDVLALEPSISGLAEGPLVNAGLGRPEEFPAGTTGYIALMKRGDLRFNEKVANASAAGAAAAIVYNSQPGPFRGQLGEAPAIPAASVSGDDGQALLDLLAAAAVTVRLDVRTQTGPRDSQNVVAKPPGGSCRVIVGGHYDSVPAGPGANDNASGTATSLEMARVLAADDELDDACFVLFGAEEVGLIGSNNFVASLSAPERQAIEGMLNFDMVAVGTRWLLAGSLALRDTVVQTAGDLGQDYTIVQDPLVGSDHASFLDAAIPAVFFHRVFSRPADDPRYHTANDTALYVDPNNLTLAGELGLAVVEAVLAGG